eukprot:jgi/Tetstr1/422137/TSEL_012992.t1
MRSEDGVQHGAPLATTSFCVAIHPEVEECDKTLEDTDGAAERFKPTMAIWWAGRNTLGRPFTPSARPSMKVQSVGLEERFDKMYAHNADMEAAQCEAPADIEWPELDGHHCMPVLNVPLGSPGYVHAYMRGKAEELQEEVEASLSKLLYGNPRRRCTHAMYHRAWVCSSIACNTLRGIGSIRNCLSSDEPEAFTEAVDATILTEAKGYYHSLNDARGSVSYDAAVREAWVRLVGPLSDADARVTEREAEAASGLRKELAAFLDQANNSRLRGEEGTLPITCWERILFGKLDAASGMWTVTIPTAVMTPHELRKALPLGKTLPMDELKDLAPDAELSLLAFNVVTGSYDPRSLKPTLLEFKTMRQKAPLRDILGMSEYTGMVFGTMAGKPCLNSSQIAKLPRP